MKTNMSKYATNLSSALAKSTNNELIGINIDGIQPSQTKEKFRTH
jgi:hypothetical protein